MEPTRRLEHKVTRDDGTFVEEEHDARSSVEITRTAAGKNSWSVKAYNLNGVKAARLEAEEEFDALDAKYGAKEPA